MDKLKQIQISKEIWAKAKIYCANHDLTLKQFIEKLINDGTKEEMPNM